MKRKIIILDGEQKSALAATRALGKKGYAVAVGSVFTSSLAGSSKYCSETFIYESPFENASGFIETLSLTADRINADILLPMTDITVFTVLKHETELNKIVEIPLCNYEQYMKASDKFNLTKTAAELGVAVPESIFITEPEKQIDTIKDTIKFPAVLKPRASLIFVNGKVQKCGVAIVNNIDELKNLIKTKPAFRQSFMIQEKLTGEGLGVFVLYNKGTLKALFGHRRLREKPPWGGVSVLCESAKPDKRAIEFSKILLENLNWQGVAMVEFKRDGVTKTPKLMEINARFWGSLQLSINSGINFPVLLLDSQDNSKELPPFFYSRMRWLLGDFDNLYIQIKTWLKSPQKTRNIATPFTAILSFFSEFFKDSKFEVFQKDDIAPFIWEIKRYLLRK